MIEFESIVKKFDQNGEKTGWTYIDIFEEIAQEINPNVKVSYRVKGKIGLLPIRQVALLPMGNGDFIIPLNADMRKVLKCRLNDKLKVTIEIETEELPISPDFLASLELDSEAQKFFNSLPKGHQRYYSNYVESAKTTATKEKRIFMLVFGLANRWDYGTIIRHFKNK